MKVSIKHLKYCGILYSKLPLLLFILFSFHLKLIMAQPSSPFVYTSQANMEEKPKLWGFATSAYQIEGAWNARGKTQSIWDDFSHRGLVLNQDTGDDAVQSYYLWESDFDILAKLNATAYRFSVSWTRIINVHDGTINKEGIEHYKTQLLKLRSMGIEPFVTLYHWDLPLLYQQSYKGWASETDQIQKDFVHYARTCFHEFKGLVKYWITFNEPAIFIELGYKLGIHAPALTLSTQDIFRCGHHVLLSHAESVRHLRMIDPDAKVGLALNVEWGEPLNSENMSDVEAAKNYVASSLGWFADPVFKGDYSDLLRRIHGENIPIFTPAQKELLMRSVDFFGLNFYTAKYVTGDPLHPQSTPRDLDGNLIGEQAQSSWLYQVPWSFEKVLNYITREYHSPDIYVTENGVSSIEEDDEGLESNIRDKKRQYYYKSYLEAMMKAIHQGAQVKGYFAWTLLDNFEWAQGYKEQFGVVSVNRSSPTMTRTIKDSAYFLYNFFNNKS